MSAFHVSGSVLDAGNTVVNKTKSLFSWSADSRRDRKTVNNIRTNEKISENESAIWEKKHHERMGRNSRKHL